MVFRQLLKQTLSGMSGYLPVISVLPRTIGLLVFLLISCAWVGHFMETCGRFVSLTVLFIWILGLKEGMFQFGLLAQG